MGKKKKRRDVKLPDVSDGGPDPLVAGALLEAWKTRYPSSDEDVAEQEVHLMKERGHCCYAVLQEGVEKQHFDGVSNYFVMPEYVQVATEALAQLQEHSCYAAVEHPVTGLKQHGESKPRRGDAKPRGGEQQAAEMNEDNTKCGKSQIAVQNDCEPTGESAQQPRSKQKHGVKVDKQDGMWDAAMNKARVELEQEFDYNKLCKQGRRLFQMVMQDKTKRLYGKLKQRAQWKIKKKEHAQQ